MASSPQPPPLAPAGPGAWGPPGAATVSPAPSNAGKVVAYCVASLAGGVASFFIAYAAASALG